MYLHLSSIIECFVCTCVCALLTLLVPWELEDGLDPKMLNYRWLGGATWVLWFKPGPLQSKFSLQLSHLSRNTPHTAFVRTCLYIVRDYWNKSPLIPKIISENRSLDFFFLALFIWCSPFFLGQSKSICVCQDLLYPYWERRLQESCVKENLKLKIKLSKTQ